MTEPAPDSPLTVTAGDLRRLMVDVFAALAVAPDDVQIVVDALMEATLAGYDSHGVMRIPRYVQELREGVMQPRGEFKILREECGFSPCGWRARPRCSDCHARIGPCL